MGNFRVDTLWPWLSFEAQDDPLGLRSPPAGFQPSGFGLTPFAYGATPGIGSEAVGLSNWRPPGTSTVPPSEPRPWWLFGDEPDPNTPWLHVRPPDGPPGFRVAPDGTVASSPTGNGTALGLDRQVPNVGSASPLVGGPFAQHAWPPTDLLADAQSWRSRPPGQGEGPDGRPGPRWSWLRTEATEEPPGLRVTSDGSVVFGQTGNGTAFGLDRQAPDVGLTVPFNGGPFAQQAWPLAEPPVETQPWWSRQPWQGEGLDGRFDLRWPWLRAEPADEPPGSGVKPDGPGNQSKPDEFNPLSFAYQPFGREALENIDVGGSQPQIGAAPTPLNPSQQSTGVDGPTAASMALPAAPVVAGSEAVGAALAEAARAALAEAAALAGRLAPAAARAASGPAAALSILVTPTNKQGDTIELGDGLRARTSTGQGSVAIERRADNGLLGTGIAARWERLPVDAELRVEKGGVARVLIDHQQLQAAVGAEATARALDAIGSAMARPPQKGNETRPSASTEDDSNQAPAPGGSSKPPTGPGPLGTAVEIGAKALERANRPQSEAREQAELIENWRQLLKRRGEPAQDGQYRGDGGVETALGVKLPPDVGEPAAGRNAFPEQEHLRKALIGEFELVNRIKAVRPDEIVLHFGNAPGAQGPDVLSIGRDRVINAWDSKSRSAERSVGPSMAASFKLDRAQVEAYVWKAINEGRLPREVGLEALQKFNDGTYNICTVGTGNAHDGMVEFFRNRESTGPRRH